MMTAYKPNAMACVCLFLVRTCLSQETASFNCMAVARYTSLSPYNVRKYLLL